MTLVATVGASNANSYVDLAYANEYFLSRLGSNSWSSSPNESKEPALIQATMMLDRLFNWEGTRTEESQALRWPRIEVVDQDGFEIDDDVIPTPVKQAECELALYILTNNGYSGEARSIDRMRIGPIMMDFDDSSAALPIPSVVIDMLNGYGVYQGSGKSGNINVPLVRV
jgi:hypothetical protein